MSELIQKRFIQSFDKTSYDSVGAEIELQLVNPVSGFVDKHVCIAYLEALCAEEGCRPTLYTADGRIHCAQNDAGDKISFDSAYNLLEFSLRHAPDIGHMRARFERIYTFADRFFHDAGCFLTGLGISPSFPRASAQPVNFGLYPAIDGYLTARGDLNFFHHVASVQSHHDCPLTLLPSLFSLLNRLDFVGMYLFANAPDLNGGQGMDVRDGLYRDSRLHPLGLTGVCDGPYRSVDDIVRDYGGRRVFFRTEGQTVKYIEPMPLNDFLAQYPDRIEDFVSCRHVEITEYGTIEQRGVACQPVGAAFMPVAFYKGICLAHDQAARLLDVFWDEHVPGLSPARLRALAAAGLPVAPSAPGAVKRLLTALTEVSYAALKGVGMGEERLLDGLFARAEQMTNPSLYFSRALASGQTPERLMRRYGDLDEEII